MIHRLSDPQVGSVPHVGGDPQVESDPQVGGIPQVALKTPTITSGAPTITSLCSTSYEMFQVRKGVQRLL